jgi:hypothetical protein
LELNPELAPFTDLLMYETLVDGKPWTHETSLGDPPVVGRSWVGRGVDKLLTLSKPEAGEKSSARCRCARGSPVCPARCSYRTCCCSGCGGGVDRAWKIVHATEVGAGEIG